MGEWHPAGIIHRCYNTRIPELPLDGNAKPEKYHITQALKFGDYNVGRDDAILTVPSYMGFFLEFEGVEDIDLPILDIDEVNRLASAMSFEQ